jgi:S-layer family protein
MRNLTAIAMCTVVAGILFSGGGARAAAPPFPDVPPWHWAFDSVTKAHDAGIVIGYPSSPEELVQAAITAVYEGFAHASSPGAESWVARFTYNRPADWPAPLARARVAAFTLTEIRPIVSGSTATATYAARITTGDGRVLTGPMRVRLRANDDDWQVDYATLAAGSVLFR